MSDVLGVAGRASCRLCLGLADFGSRLTGAEATRLLEEFVSAAGAIVDTAHCYACWTEAGQGSSERQLGRSLADLGCRDRLTIVTKGGHPAAGDSYQRPAAYLSPEVVQRDLTESLDRLGLDGVDAFLLHRDDPRVPVGEVVDMLDAEVRARRTRLVGVSNWAVARVAEANAYAADHGRRPVAVSQVHWSLADPLWTVGPDPTMRYMTPSDAAWHAASGLPVMAYSASAGGYLAGREAAEAAYGSPTNAGRRDRARELAARLGVTPTQLTLAYLLSHPFAVYPIVGAMASAHLAEAMGAGDLRLSEQQVAWLRDGGMAEPGT